MTLIRVDVDHARELRELHRLWTSTLRESGHVGTEITALVEGSPEVYAGGRMEITFKVDPRFLDCGTSSGGWPR